MKLFIRLLILTFIFPASIVYSQDFTQSNLPIIIIETNGQVIPDEPKIEVDMGIIYNGPGQINYLTDPLNEYDGIVGIEKRGSTSQSFFPKRSYAFETRDSLGNNLNVSLLGMPDENDWILYAPYSDKSLLRNVLASKFSNDMGHYASRTHFCELVKNGEYKGVYVLMEKIKRDVNRVNIAEMGEDDIAGDSLTGGYIIKLDKSSGSYTSGWTSSFPPYPGAWQEIFYRYHYPKEQNIQDEQMEYIQEFIFEFESIMDSEGYNDPVTGYSAIIDMNSFVDFVLVNELAKNVDAYRLSTYFHKNRNSINSSLKAGPIWDFNIALGNADYYGGYNPEGWIITEDVSFGDFYTLPFWWKKMMEDPAFFQNMVLRWNLLKQDVLQTDEALDYIDNMVVYLDEAQQRNFERWPILGEDIWPNYFIGETYEDEVEFLKEWINDRIAWMDEALELQPIITEINYHSSPEMDAGDWIEIYNAKDENLNLSGWKIKTQNEVVFTFPSSSFIQAESNIVICEDLAQFQAVFPNVLNCIGDLSTELYNEGETLELCPSGQADPVDMLTFSNSSPWPLYASGTGNTIVLNQILTDNADPMNWHTSFYAGGSPGSFEPVPETPLLFINEIMADNGSIITDEYGDYDDWIEIYNGSEIPVDVGGMYISDGNNLLFRIPQTNPVLTTIPWGEYLLLWADNEPEEGALHLDFKLSKEGERIDLFLANGFSIVDSVAFGSQETDISFGRIVDGASDWITFDVPTPNASNSGTNSTEVIEQAEMNVYPNPAKDNFWVDLKTENFSNASLRLYDIFGHVVLIKKMKDSRTIISTTSLNNGIYLVVFENDREKVLEKITVLKD